MPPFIRKIREIEPLIFLAIDEKTGDLDNKKMAEIIDVLTQVVDVGIVDFTTKPAGDPGLKDVARTILRAGTILDRLPINDEVAKNLSNRAIKTIHDILGPMTPESVLKEIERRGLKVE